MIPTILSDATIKLQHLSRYSGLLTRFCITIPDSGTALGDWAFRGCTALTRLAIPDSVTSIGYDTFGSCPDLTLTVGRGSYAAQYAEENSIPYAFANAGS